MGAVSPKLLADGAVWASNISSAVGIIFVNKLLMSSQGYNFRFGALAPPRGRHRPPPFASQTAAPPAPPLWVTAAEASRRPRPRRSNSHSNTGRQFRTARHRCSSLVRVGRYVAALVQPRGRDTAAYQTAAGPRGRAAELCWGNAF